ncbi:hypothetical protein [Kytococcus sp. Marseille-QA3725]
MSSLPPGWPAAVRPVDAPGWQEDAVAWLLDLCPADFRAYRGWRRHPVMLAWIAERHVAGQVEVLRQAWRDVRLQVGVHVPPEALPSLLEHLAAEGRRLAEARRGAELISEALQGGRWVPRL